MIFSKRLLQFTNYLLVMNKVNKYIDLTITSLFLTKKTPRSVNICFSIIIYLSNIIINLYIWHIEFLGMN